MDQETNTEAAAVPAEETVTPTADSDMPIAQEAPAAKRPVFFLAGIAVVVLAVAGVAAWHFLDLGNKTPDTAGVSVTTGLTEAEANEPVAYVNGVSVTRGALAENIEQMTQGALAQGVDPNDLVIKAQIEEQAYEITVNNELLKQAANNETARPTDAEMDAEIALLTEQNGGEEALAALLAEIGFTKEMLRQNVADSLHIKAYLASKQTPVTVSDAEVDEFYTSLGGEEAGLPPLTDVRDQVVAELERQKIDAQVSTIIEELRADATIEKVS